jgi:predicted dehydrogenase/threonine dehydrogenase-like Zn-dependent dehydrogenase
MKQLVQNLKNGKTEILDVPAPVPPPGSVLVKTAVSVVSVGTERSVVEFAGRNLLGKARSRPDLVRQLVQKGRHEGWLAAVEGAFNRLGQPMALGYSSAGEIIRLGEGVSEFRIGDRVACAGGGHAVHAEFASVPVNLLAQIPKGVDLEEASFATLGAIALHGFRLSRATLGENVLVVGLGVLGLLAGQIAQAAGCRVLAMDVDPRRVTLAGRLGMDAVRRESAARRGLAFTNGKGFDAVLICADTPSSDPLELAGALARDRGTVVAVGAVGMSIPRKPYYEKEIDFQISRSYGPGRYDPVYEEAGVDYPYGYVRWTEGRNLAAFLHLLEDGKVKVAPLISHRFPVERGDEAYRLISGKKKTRQAFLGVVLTYSSESKPQKAVTMATGNMAGQETADKVRLGVLGAGNFAVMVALPAIAANKNAARVSIVSAGGLSAAQAARRFGFTQAGSDPETVFGDPAVQAVGIFTRHHLHASQVIAALRAGKHVFCEKPLALTPDELDAVGAAYRKADGRILMVGYNRRFAPMVQRMKNRLDTVGLSPSITIRVNAGPAPAGHWTMDPAQGGGRILGEACHFVDLMAFLAGSQPIRVTAGNVRAAGQETVDNFSALFEFAGGAVGTLTYTSAGDRAFGKERIEAFCGGEVFVLDDFRRLDHWYEGTRRTWQSRLRQDKGHRAAWDTFILAVRKGGSSPIPIQEILTASQATFALQKALREAKPVDIR